MVIAHTKITGDIRKMVLTEVHTAVRTTGKVETHFGRYLITFWCQTCVVVYSKFCHNPSVASLQAQGAQVFSFAIVIKSR